MKYQKSNHLTDREAFILDLLTKGYDNNHIANELYISPHTVKAYISTILKKLQARNRTHAVYRAVKEGLIQ